MKYHVWLQALVNVRAPDIDADRPVDAIEAAIAQTLAYDGVLPRRPRGLSEGVYVEFTGEVPYALVDEDGDAQDAHSCWYAYVEGQWLPDTLPGRLVPHVLVPRVLQALAELRLAGNDERTNQDKHVGNAMDVLMDVLQKYGIPLQGGPRG